MPVFSSEYFAQVELAKNLKSVMQNAPNALSRANPASMTASLNFDTGEVSYDFVEKKSTTTAAPSTTGSSTTT